MCRGTEAVALEVLLARPPPLLRGAGWLSSSLDAALFLLTALRRAERACGLERLQRRRTLTRHSGPLRRVRASSFLGDLVESSARASQAATDPRILVLERTDLAMEAADFRPARAGRRGGHQPVRIGQAGLRISTARIVHASQRWSNNLRALSLGRELRTQSRRPYSSRGETDFAWATTPRGVQTSGDALAIRVPPHPPDPPAAWRTSALGLWKAS